jgi:hypothetical protein
VDEVDDLLAQVTGRVPSGEEVDALLAQVGGHPVRERKRPRVLDRDGFEAVKTLLAEVVAADPHLKRADLVGADGEVRADILDGAVRIMKQIRKDPKAGGYNRGRPWSGSTRKRWVEAALREIAGSQVG